MTRQTDKEKPVEAPVQSRYAAQYTSLAKFIMKELPDTAFTVFELTELIEINGGLWISGPYSTAKLEQFTLNDLRGRMAHMETTAMMAARPRPRPNDADGGGVLNEFYTTGAFYRIGDGTRQAQFIWERRARWFWDPRVHEARLWNASQQHMPSSNAADIMKHGTVLTNGRLTNRREVMRFDPLSKLPDGVELPPIETAPAVPIAAMTTTLSPAPRPMAVVPEPPAEPAVVARGTEATIKIIANDAEDGGSFIFEMDGDLYVTVITKRVES